jgi:hypothetical protein
LVEVSVSAQGMGLVVAVDVVVVEGVEAVIHLFNPCELYPPYWQLA